MEEENPVGLISARTRLHTGSLVSVGLVLKHGSRRFLTLKSSLLLHRLPNSVILRGVHLDPCLPVAWITERTCPVERFGRSGMVHLCG
jgi:hypothetical protein